MGPFYVANGGLSSVYSTAQFHFHWGADNGMGSEHQVDGQSFPLEVREIIVIFCLQREITPSFFLLRKITLSYSFNNTHISISAPRSEL